MCWQCLEPLKSQDQFDKHQAKRHAHQCSHTGCSFSFISECRLRVHQFHQHALNMSKVKQCNQCQEQIDNKSYQQHLKTRHDHPCSECSVTASALGIWSHKILVHNLGNCRNPRVKDNQEESAKVMIDGEDESLQELVEKSQDVTQESSEVKMEDIKQENDSNPCNIPIGRSEEGLDLVNQSEDNVITLNQSEDFLEDIIQTEDNVFKINQSEKGVVKLNQSEESHQSVNANLPHEVIKNQLEPELLDDSEERLQHLNKSEDSVMVDQSEERLKFLNVADTSIDQEDISHQSPPALSRKTSAVNLPHDEIKKQLFKEILGLDVSDDHEEQDDVVDGDFKSPLPPEILTNQPEKEPLDQDDIAHEEETSDDCVKESSQRPKTRLETCSKCLQIVVKGHSSRDHKVSCLNTDCVHTFISESDRDHHMVRHHVQPPGETYKH